MKRMLGRACPLCLLTFFFCIPLQSVAQTTVAGFTPGSFRVNESGAAAYTIPIQVPPGVAGMEPKLAFTYNSKGRNGLLGMGWGLSGLSAITRCPQTVAQDGPQDGFVGGINFNERDRYCLDGQRLVMIAGASYGADGAEYRTERESFTKVISYAPGGGPQWFKVWTKAGQILEYGNTGDSRIEAQGNPTVRVWALNKISDKKGNYLTVAYAEDNTNGDFYPTKIEYNWNTGTPPTANASVQFVPELATRSDVVPAYVAGSVVKTLKRLAYVRTYVGVNLVKEYRLIYDNNGAVGRSRLSSIAECDGAGTCLPQTSFAWSQADPGWAGSNPAAAIYGATTYLIGDFDGDGKVDIAQVNAAWPTIPVCYSTGTGWNCNNQAANYLGGGGAGNSGSGVYSGAQFVVGDFNGDGKADIAQVNNTWPSIPVCYSTGTGWNCYNQAANYLGGGGAGNSGSGIYSDAHFVVGDFNGDGMADIAQVNDTWPSIPVCYSTGTGWNCYNQAANYLGGISAGNSGSGVYSGGRYLVGDFNGDGKVDVAQVNATWGSIPVCYSTGTGWNCYNQAANYLGGGGAGNSGSGVYSGANFLVGDFNGDGKADIAQVNNTWPSIPVCYSTGTGWNCYNQAANYLGGGGAGNSGSGIYGGANFLVGDFNGDGKADFAQVNNTWPSIPVCYSTGTGWNCYNQSAGAGTGNSGSGIYKGAQFLVGDSNGDGKTDVLEISNTFSSIPVVSATGAIPDLLFSISNGLGATVSITYRPLTDNTVYTKFTGSTVYQPLGLGELQYSSSVGYPVIDLQAPLYVVSSASTSDGVGGSYLTNYKYFGLKAHLQGGGLLGFAYVQATDPQTGIVSSSAFRQDYPFQGLMSGISKVLGTDPTINKVLNTWGASLIPNGTGKYHRCDLTASVDTSRDLNGALLRTVTTSTTYDGYGNATSITASTGDGYSKTTSNTYAPADTVNWLLSRPISSQVTSTTP